MQINIVDFLKQQNSKFLFLLLFLMVLPSLEAPKNLFALLFVISWLFVSKREQDWGGKWRLIDSIFLLWIVADIAVGLNAVIFHDLSANGSKDIVKFILVGWAVSRSSFNAKQIVVLIVSTVVFSVIPLIESYNNGKVYVELNSVGHVNHTAIYLLISYIISLSLLVLDFKNLGNFLRTLLTITTFVLAYVVVDTNSRAASGVFVIFSLLLLSYSIYYYKNNTITASIVAFVLLMTSLVVHNPPPVVDKFISGTNLIGDSPRQKIRNHVYYTFKTSPILGIGFGNYVHFGHDEIKDIVIKEKGEYDSSEFLPSAHPHNVYYTYLVSGGMIMFFVFILFWLHVLKIIYLVNKGSSEKWLVLSSLGVIVTILGIGWVNTTLAHEHALISMFVLGLLISKYRELA